MGFLLFGGISFAQDADKIISDSRNKLEGLSDFTADFEYSIENIKGRTVSKKGTIIYQKEKFVIKLPEEAIYCDGTTQWLHLSESEEVYITDYDSEEGLNIESIFGIYESGGKARYDGEESVNGVLSHKIFLALQGSDVEYNQAVVFVSKKSKLFTKVLLIDRNQTKTTFSFKNIRTNVGFDADTFRWTPDKGPNAEVYDERL